MNVDTDGLKTLEAADWNQTLGETLSFELSKTNSSTSRAPFSPKEEFYIYSR
jgi:hypothetical protein